MALGLLSHSGQLVGSLAEEVADALSRFRSRHHAYEPSSRYCHVSALCQGRVVIWGGTAKDDTRNYVDIRQVVEIYDPVFEGWHQQLTTGVSPPAIVGNAKAAVMDLLHVFGGKDGTAFRKCLHQLSTTRMEWRELAQQNPEDGPMKKGWCAMVSFSDDKLALFGGYGISTDVIQPGSTFIRDEKVEGLGWTNEFHHFNIKEGTGIY